MHHRISEIYIFWFSFWPLTNCYRSSVETCAPKQTGQTEIRTIVIFIEIPRCVPKGEPSDCSPRGESVLSLNIEMCSNWVVMTSPNYFNLHMKGIWSKGDYFHQDLLRPETYPRKHHEEEWSRTPEFVIGIFSCSAMRRQLVTGQPYFQWKIPLAFWHDHSSKCKMMII